jgi:hypothetical protein
MQHFSAGPAAGAPHGFVFVDVDRAELLDDVGGAVGRFHAGGAHRQHHVATVQRLGVDMAVGVVAPQQLAEHLLDGAEDGGVVVDARGARHAAGIAECDGVAVIAAMYQFVLGSVGLGTGFKYSCQCVCHDGAPG